MNKLAIAFLVLAPCAVAANALQVTQVTPPAGSIVGAGEQIRISWNVQLDDDALITDCEQEIFLSLDGGVNNHLRLTPMMSPLVREFIWTVPAIPAKRAVLDLRFSCAESEELFTMTPWNPQTQFRFTIEAKAPRPPQTVSVASTDRNVASGGDTVGLTWQSSVKGVSSYRILGSFDRGAHFVPLGSVKGNVNSFEWRVPSNAAGGVIFQVVANRRDGSTVAGPIPLRSDLTVE
ncbi:MAG TPA: hypothetical protein VN783_11905 [Thermoanaerobaculia bacterium]|nr:hypothetical protein [Thermoanaerobaculia bacterium]